MRWFRVIGGVVLAAVLADTPAQEVTVTGTIRVVKTRVRTRGAKSQRHVVVYLEPVKKRPLPAPKKRPRIDQKGLVFIPHVLAVQTGTTVEFTNSDTVNHNIFCEDECCKIVVPGGTRYMDLGTFPPGQVRTFTFKTPGEAVLLCKLHPEMAAYVIVVDTPYFTVAEVDGKTQRATYTIHGVPPGEYRLKVWNKKCTAPPRKVTVPAGRKELRLDLEITRKRRRR